MRLRKECEHGLYDGHNVQVGIMFYDCPGGEFLPEGAIVVDPKNVEEVAEALVVLDALMESFGDPGGFNGL